MCMISRWRRTYKGVILQPYYLSIIAPTEEGCLIYSPGATLSVRHNSPLVIAYPNEGVLVEFESVQELK